MGLTQNLGRLSPSIFSDASLNIGVGAAPSGSYKFEVTGTSKVSGVLTLGSTLSNGTYTYTLPAATGTLALTSQIPANPVGGTGTTNYLSKFTAATTIGNSLIQDNGTNLSINRAIDASTLLILKGIGATSSTYGLYLLNSASTTNFYVNDAGNSYFGNSIGIGTSPTNLNMLDVLGAAKFSGQLTLGSTITNGTYTYTLPSATGTLALTSALSGYLPLAGGTLTGALGGTSATFSQTTSNKLTLSGGTSQNGLTLDAVSGAGNSFYIFNGNGGLGNGFGVYNITTSTLPFYISNAGAATFNSTVDASRFNGNLLVGSATVGGSVKFNYGANAVSRSYIIVSDAYNYGDLGFQQSTTQTGSTYTNKMILAANGDLTIGTVPSTGVGNLYAGAATFSTSIITPSLYGKSYAQTSTSGTTSYVDTGIYFNTSITGFSNNAIYELVVSGNPNGAGSSEYRSVYLGYIFVTTGYDFAITNVVQRISYTQVVTGDAYNIGALTISVVFWNGTTETTQQITGTTSNQIRVKITGYNSGNIGAAQVLTLNKVN